MCQDAPRSQPEPLADDQLLAAYRDGDEAAAAALFERYYVRLLRLAREQMGAGLREVEESADVAQSVFQSVFLRSRARQIEVGPEGSLWPLLATITLNKIRNRAKFWNRRRRDRRRQVSVDDCDPLETGPSPEDALRLRDLIEQLLEPFSEPRRKTIEFLLQEIPPEEIARRVGTSKRTVYRTRQAAMEILKQILVSS